MALPLIFSKRQNQSIHLFDPLQNHKWLHLLKRNQNIMKQIIYVLMGILVASACQESENFAENSDFDETVELIDSSEITDLKKESNFDLDLSLLKGNTYLALFNSSSNNPVLIEPACLSDCPSISFERLEHDKIVFACGQDFMDYTILDASQENGLFSFALEGEVQLKLELLEETEENPFEHIRISLSDFQKLYMGYYEDSITSINSQKLIMMLNNEANREVLRDQNRWTTIPCPEDMFD